jgi:hypothetical protein
MNGRLTAKGFGNPLNTNDKRSQMIKYPNLARFWRRGCLKLFAKKYIGTMKNIGLSFSFVLLAFVGMWLSSCGPAPSTQTVDIGLNLTGSMLFEGANSLQYANEGQLTELAGTLGTDISAIQNVAVSKVVITLDDMSRPITESLLLQIVSDHQELVTIGTLNPLPEGTQFTLSLAEDTSLLPYLKDSGTTWVLDLNVTEDYLDEMVVNGKLTLSVDYLLNKN